MALVNIVITEKNNKLLAKTYLFNTEKIVDFHLRTGSTTVTEFFYSEVEGRRTKTNKYVTTLSKAAFEALFDIATYESRLDLNITQIFTPTVFDVVRVQNFAVKGIQKCWDIDGSSSMVEYDRGNFETIKVNAAHTLAEIAGAVSTSVSVAI